MGEKNDIITQYVWNQRLKDYRFVIVILLVLSVPIGFTMFNWFRPVTESKILIGVVESLHQGHSGTGTEDILFVRLNDGNLVNVPIGRVHDIPFRKLAEVRIERIEKASGMVSYSFRGYVK